MTTTNSPSGELTGKTALITGGSAGIGRATAILLAHEGARVAITGRNAERGQEVVREIEAAGGEAIFMVSDVRFADHCERAVGETLERYGRIDILFNNAGVYYPKTVPDCSESEWDLTIDTSLKGAFLMSKYTLPSMIERGSGVIIHCSSGWGIQGGGEAAAYCAAKGGLVVMTKAMAIDHGPQGIRVNCVCPGDVDTPTRYVLGQLHGGSQRPADGSRRSPGGDRPRRALSIDRRLLVRNRHRTGGRRRRHRRVTRNEGLVRVIGPGALGLSVVNLVVGAGIFVLPGRIAAELG